jgi:hypothetical protein
MVDFLESLQDYGKQWRFSFGLATFTWFAGICFVRLLPPPLQLITMLIPVVGYLYALYVIPKWQKEGKQTDLIESLTEREGAHALMNQHHFNLAAMDLDQSQRMNALQELYPQPKEDEADQAAALSANSDITIQQQIQQVSGEVGWKLFVYLTGSGEKHCDENGWIALEKLRANWAKNHRLNTEELTRLLSIFTQYQLGEWKDGTCTEWRLILTV